MPNPALVKVTNTVHSPEFDMDEGAHTPVVGLADIHVHQMSHLAFGGAWIWGEHDGPAAQALRNCSGQGLDHGFLAGSEGGTGNLRAHDCRGFPNHEGWPTWKSISHQQCHADWLQKAHADGLRLMVMSAVEQSDFCSMVPRQYCKFHDVNDFDSIKRQLDATHEFANKHSDWYGIALTPAEAREIIAKGKLAVVLAVEAGDLWGSAAIEPRLNDLYGMGVRSVQPVHETDNRFCGAAWHDPPLLALEAMTLLKHPAEGAKQLKSKISDMISHHKSGADRVNDFAEKLAGFNLDENGKNLKGLTSDGQELVHQLISRNMLVDLSHMSERAIVAAFDIAKGQGYYPLFNSHGHFSDAEPTQSGEWNYSLAVYQVIASTGGVVGVRSSSTTSRTYLRSRVANDCDGSLKSFAHRLEWAQKELGLDCTLASDFGGFAQNSSPRFGSDAADDCTSAARKKKQQAAQSGAKGRAIDTRGFAHMGLLGEVMAELGDLGTDASSLQGLQSSAEKFLLMWERAEDAKRLQVPKVIDQQKALATLGPIEPADSTLDEIKEAAAEAAAAAKQAAEKAAAEAKQAAEKAAAAAKQAAEKAAAEAAQAAAKAAAAAKQTAQHAEQKVQQAAKTAVKDVKQGAKKLLKKLF